MWLNRERLQNIVVVDLREASIIVPTSDWSFGGVSRRWV